ncbi:hypothetical protein DRE_02199 [Drechslerella stenobrocha 248]|uniref:PPPDE domain-containing protein n=1 Tax=Drechslerella stenobrocha 248 TaxID=1043628 RepID=W7IGS5_9PEZI|nr:hypothetical protein DRE_02199 [Drechslerella stenobrocha 248]
MPLQDDRRNSDAAGANDDSTKLITGRSSDSSGIPITINVYDLLPPGKISTVFWTLGVGLLHTGVAINDREYAFGGHDRRGVTGVYWMKPRQEPPGATFRTGFVHGHTSHSIEEIQQIMVEVSAEFQGTFYNVLTRNCNHFTTTLCERLTGKPAPKWINRAASIGVALPCVVPQAWVKPPECEEEDQLNPEDFDDEGEWDDDYDGQFGIEESDVEDAEEAVPDGKSQGGKQGKEMKGDGVSVSVSVSRKSTDEEGRLLPQSERANLDRTVD